MKLALLGGGGHCRSCIEVILSSGENIAGIVTPESVENVFGYPRLGDDSWLDSDFAKTFHHLVTVGQVGSAATRVKIFESLRCRGLRLATIKASSSTVSEQAYIGAGTILMHRVVINTGAKVGDNCIINTGAIIEHDAQVSDHCHISTGAIVNGGAYIGPGSMLGSGAIVLQGVSIAPYVMVGAGAVVTKSIDTSGTWVGVPARRLQ